VVALTLHKSGAMDDTSVSTGDFTTDFDEYDGLDGCHTEVDPHPAGASLSSLLDMLGVDRQWGKPEPVLDEPTVSCRPPARTPVRAPSARFRSPAPRIARGSDAPPAPAAMNTRPAPAGARYREQPSVPATSVHTRRLAQFVVAVLLAATAALATLALARWLAVPDFGPVMAPLLILSSVSAWFVHGLLGPVRTLPAILPVPLTAAGLLWHVPSPTVVVAGGAVSMIAALLLRFTVARAR
jgi:hypothetical protein